MKNFKRMLISLVFICGLTVLLVEQMYAIKISGIIAGRVGRGAIPHGVIDTIYYSINYYVEPEEQRPGGNEILWVYIINLWGENDLLNSQKIQRIVSVDKVGSFVLDGILLLKNTCGSIWICPSEYPLNWIKYGGKATFRIWVGGAGTGWHKSPWIIVQAYQSSQMSPNPGFTMTDDACHFRGDTATINIFLHDTLKGAQSGYLGVFFDNTFLQAIDAQFDHNLFDTLYSHTAIHDTGVAFNLVPYSPMVFSDNPIGTIRFSVKENSPYKETTLRFDTLGGFIDILSVPMPSYLMKSDLIVIPNDSLPPAINPELITCFSEKAHGLPGSITDNYGDIPGYVRVSWFDMNDSLLGLTWVNIDGSFLLENYTITHSPGDTVYMIATDALGNFSSPPSFFKVSAIHNMLVDGWNMVSVPLVVSDYRKNVIYPTAESDAFTYKGSYVARDTLETGVGYWLKFIGNQDVQFFGSPIFRDTINVVNGWNMIGSLSEPIQVGTITSDPPGIVTGEFFTFDSVGYSTSDTIKPGKGYWVRAAQSGKLIPASAGLDLAKTQAARIHIVPTSELPPLPPDGLLAVGDNIPHEYALEQAYPNPFNPTTTIKYQLPNDSKVSLKIYNLLGQVVAVLADGVQSASYQSVEWNASSASSSVYFYKLDAVSMTDPSKTFSSVRKMVLLK